MPYRGRLSVNPNRMPSLRWFLGFQGCSMVSNPDAFRLLTPVEAAVQGRRGCSAAGDILRERDTGIPCASAAVLPFSRCVLFTLYPWKNACWNERSVQKVWRAASGSATWHLDCSSCAVTSCTCRRIACASAFKEMTQPCLTYLHLISLGPAHLPENRAGLPERTTAEQLVPLAVGLRVQDQLRPLLAGRLINPRNPRRLGPSRWTVCPCLRHGHWWTRTRMIFPPSSLSSCPKRSADPRPARYACSATKHLLAYS